MATRSTIIVHGGAAAWPPTNGLAEAGCRRAAELGAAVLAAGGDALTAVETAVRALEDDGVFNAGYGAVLTREGTVEHDAVIIDGEMRAGAVASLVGQRNPISVARRVLERCEHVFLVGEGARRYAVAEGFAEVDPATMITPAMQARYDAERIRRTDEPARSGDTVGACAIDANGRVAAGTSTGGTFWKRPGRVGDAPIIGAGAYADDRLGAFSTTGHGESILRVGLARTAAERLRAGDPISIACRYALADLAERTGGTAGIIGVDAAGHYAHATITPHMPWAAVPRRCVRERDGRVRIRQARPDDAVALSRAVADQPLLHRYGVTADGLAREIVRSMEAGDELLVADEGGKPIGLAWFLQRGGFGLGGYLRLIALAPGTESAGIGRALLDAVEQAVSSRHLFLLVSDFNHAAQRFYERQGYVKRGELPGLVLPDVTEIIYWKRLR